GFPYDVVDAVLAAQRQNPAGAARAVRRLAEWTARVDWHEILPAYARCVRITRDLKERYEVDEKVISAPAEEELYTILLSAEALEREPGSVEDFFNAFMPMIPKINKFFDDVLVMSENRTERENRLGMLQRISDLAAGVADFSKLEGF
ncbi:MAG: hypothetical protein MUO76_12700, partial [Anaerolineaceae bacterium]|nr:hypothetical protein [Anaerolineaceae bacterium]